MPRTTENHMKIYVTYYYKKKEKEKGAFLHISPFWRYADFCNLKCIKTFC